MTEDEPHDLDLTLPPPPERAGLRTRVSGLTRRLGE
jgi:hypothetical protein